MSPNIRPENDQPHWRKSSYSNGAGGECVECAFPSGAGALVRDSKVVDGDTIRCGARAWAEFLRSVH
ncbi:DUF397 domain-containing protein [Streptomyces longispororuber]|uniref:DUF397 domain-containing protein n=1 Tax=Streptomyces longispororuber TaxID=68230 RepID=UPI00210EA5A3|nr:DUF397 domain-containing protein [Streptomyces longispororuber]MCQ4209519.1 DUF397 domain-containing protein [Streptomyces longispororuber]